MGIERILLTIVICVFSVVAYANTADRVVGVWTTPEGKSRVEVFKCQHRYCGKIVWLKEPSFEPGHPRAGQLKTDDRNPDTSQHHQPLVGLQLMKGFVYDGDDVWVDGEIYDPENGKTYSCKMTLENNNTLNVRGFIGFSFIGRTSVWTR